MARHSSVLAWRIPGMGEPGGLLSMGLHRVGHDWSDLAAAAAATQDCSPFSEQSCLFIPSDLFSSSKCLYSFFFIQETPNHFLQPSSTVSSSRVERWPAHPQAKSVVAPNHMPFLHPTPSIPFWCFQHNLLSPQSEPGPDLSPYCPDPTQHREVPEPWGQRLPSLSHTHTLGLPASYLFPLHLAVLVSAGILPKPWEGGQATLTHSFNYLLRIYSVPVIVLCNRKHFEQTYLNFFLFFLSFFGCTAWHVKSQFSNWESNPRLLLWKCQVLTIESPGKFPE